MKKIFLLLFIIFFTFSCFNSNKTETVISKELENKNVSDDVNIEKIKSIKIDFEKDLDWFFEKTISWSKN